MVRQARLYIIETHFLRAGPGIKNKYFHRLCIPAPLGNLFGVHSVFLNIAAMSDQHIFVVMDALAGARGYAWIARCRETNGLIDKVIATGAVAHVHIKRRRSGALFLVAIDDKAVSGSSPEEELFHCGRVAVEVDNHRTIFSEERLEHFLVQAMWMIGILLQYHQVGDVYHAHSQLGHLVAQDL